MERIADGAEAVIYKEENTVIKDRVEKSYRIPILDEELRFFRTRREQKIIEKLTNAGVKVPSILASPSKSQLVMSYIDGIKLRDYVTKDNFEEIAKIVGGTLGKIHSLDIIHGDLTTSNMIFSKGEIYFIDFGLSFVSTRIEDRAVDLHLLRQALESYHFAFWERMYEIIITYYKSAVSNSEDVLKRLEVVERRGRNRF
jgi:TP53 regulating kinase and related kinases